MRSSSRPANSSHRHTPRLVFRGALVIAASLAIVWSALTLHIPFLASGGQIITATLASIANARVGQPVRINGVDVGQVAAVAAGPNGTGVLKLRIGSGIRVHTDARLDLRWRTFFGGNMAVALDPGSPSAPALRGPLPISATRSQIEFDQLLEPFDPPGRDAVRQLLLQTSVALARPAAPRTAAALLAPTMAGAETTLEALRGTVPGDLATLVRSTGRAAAALSSSEHDLGDLIDSASITLGVTAARREDVGRLLDASPAALTQTTVAMRRLRGTLDQLDPLVSDLRPAAPLVAAAVSAAKPGLTSLTHVLHLLRPALASLSDAVGGLRTLAPVAVPVLQQLRPSLERLRSAVLPALDRVQPDNGLRLYEVIGPWFAAATSSVDEFDGIGHMVRFQVNGGEGTLNPTSCQVTTLPSNSVCAVLATLIQKLTGALR
jgi:phospholipid/cholesterol/gamma-HCH transport system substrate-binding protein